MTLNSEDSMNFNHFFFTWAELLINKFLLNGVNKGNNKITELQTILQRESKNS
jgi:hypothetical protein